jgi:quercetin dioxygenase-like cupin family protein
MRITSTAIVPCVFILTVVTLGSSQDRESDRRARNPGLPGWCETPVADRKVEPGCYTTAISELGALPIEPLYWHLDTFPDRTTAESRRAARSVVVDGHGKHWLFTIAEQAWRPVGGDRVAMVGPLVVDRDTPYTARYMETVIPPGFQEGRGPGHRHPGPEAWFLVAGGQCLETPNGVMTARAGQSMLAPEGWPMAIASLGTETRRAVVLVLHRSSQPYVQRIDHSPDAPHAHWMPRGSCPK